jgi:hypothetical protein
MGRALHYGARIAGVAATAVRDVFQREGLTASVSLLTAGGQIVVFAAQTASRHLGSALAWATSTASGTHRSTAARGRVGQIARGLVIAADPRSALALAFASLLLVGIIATRRRRPASPPQTPTVRSPFGDMTDDDRDRLAHSLFVVLGADGAVRVHGIPTNLEPEIRARIAHIASLAAEDRLERLISRGHPLTELDMCAINVAARAAVTRRLDQYDTGDAE